MTSICEKKISAEVRLIHVEQISWYNFIVLRKNNRHSWRRVFLNCHEQTAMITALHPPKIWEQLVDGVYSIFKCMYLENFFHHINTLHQNITFNMGEESNGELAFLDTLLKCNKGMISNKETYSYWWHLNYSSFTESTLCKLLFKPTDQVVAEDINNIIYEIDCSDCEVVYLGESKQSL